MAELIWFFAVMSIWSFSLVFDRLILQRGRVSIVSCSLSDMQNDYWRFVLKYNLGCKPFWGEISYNLTDLKNPKTVISGRARDLKHAKSGINDEYLHIKEALTKTSGEHEWELHITATTVVGHLNPLYKCFPLVTQDKFKVTLNAKAS